MRILFVVHGFPPECSGGTESYVLALAKELSALGDSVEVVTGSHEGRPEVATETYEHERIKVHKIHRSGLFVDNWDKSYAPEIGPALETIADTFRPELVHVHHWIRLSRDLIEFFHDRGIPALCTLHDLGTTCPLAFRIRHGSFCELPAGAASCHDCAPHAERADDRENAAALDLFRDDFKNELDLARRVIVPSRAHRDAVLRHHPSIAGKVRVLPHGTIGSLRPHAAAGAAKGGDRIRIGHWGHLSKLKGVDILLDAVGSLPPAIQDRISLDVFGTIVYPDERPAIEAAARKARAVLHGPYAPRDLEKVALDLAVIPTRCSESFSFVLDEAFQLGLPALVPARGALAERVGRAGATFTPEDPADLARLLTEVVDSPRLLAEWKAAIPAPRPFLAHARAVLGVYRDVLSTKAPLATTHQSLRARRARLRSLQVEARTRRIEFLEGDKRNLAADVQRASATMREMQRAHVEKDKVIADLKSRLEASALQQAGTAGTVESMEARLAEAGAAVTALAADLGKARLELNEVVRKAAEHEHEVGAAAGAARKDADARLQEAARQADARLQEAARQADARLQEAARQADARERRLAERAASERDESVRRIGQRDALLGAAATALEQMAHRLAEAEQAATRPAPATAHPEGGSLIERIKRTAFGDDRKATTRIRILYVLHQFLPRHVAGTEVYTFNLARQMRAKGNRVAILTCEAHHDRAPFEYSKREQDGLPIHEVVHNYKWSSFEETYDSPRADAIFERVLDEERPDVVHIQHLHYLSANFIAIARRRGIPVVYTLHDYSILCARDGQLRRADGEICLDAVPSKCADCIGHFALDSAHVPARSRTHANHPIPPEVKRLVQRVHAGLSPVPDPDEAEADASRDRYVEAASERLKAWRHAVRGVDLFVSPSRFLRDLFARTGMIPPDRIIVSANGQDLARFDHLPPRKRGPALRFGYVGTIAEHKGIHVLVEAMNRLRDLPAAECRIHGDTKAFVEYTDRIVALNKNPRTKLLGPFRNQDVGRILSEIDVLVIPSLWFENAPLTIQEAALARIPVIASDHGGLAEHVIEGVTGLKFFVGDAGDLRNKLAWFVEDFSRCDRFDFSKVPVVSIQEDADRTEQRYLALIAGAPAT